MEETKDERYLGDIISTDGKNLKNIRARISKGKGIVNKIFTMLEGIPFGKKYFEIGILLRDSLLISSMLFNSEAWYNVTDEELNLLETIDLKLLRKLLQALLLDLFRTFSQVHKDKKKIKGYSSILV